jgi:GT2 family glycosyltransferase
MTFSVIVPTASRPALLEQLLHSLRAQIFDHSFEIIVVDDRCSADLNHLPFRTDRAECRVLPGEGNGPARARNLGADQARGTYLLFLDDDAMVDPLYLARILKEIEARPNHAVSGVQIAIDRGNSFCLASEWMHHLFVKDQRLAAPLSKFAASNGLALRRTDFQQCGGFDPCFPLAAGEDREFSARWIALGFHIIVLNEAAIEHHFPASFASLMKQQWRYGRGAFHFESRLGLKPRAPVRNPRFYLRMLTEAPLRYGLRRGLLVGMLSWTSQGIIACGYLRERISPAVRSTAGLAATKRAAAD